MFVTIVKRKMQIDERRWLRGQVLAKIKAEGQIREQDEIKKRGSERRTMMDGGEEEQEALIISLLWPKWAVSSCSGIKRSLSQLLYLFIYLFFFSVGVIWSSAVSYRSVKAGGTLAFHVYLWPGIDICPEWSDPDLASPTLYSNTHRRHVCPWEQNDVYNTLIVQMCLMPTWFQRREKESDREREKT